MEPAVWGFIGVIVGGLITGMVTLGVELIRANKAASLDSAKRQDDRQFGRDQFQRETLLELQGAIEDLMLALGQIVKGGPGSEFARTGLPVGRLGSRVDDDLVRMAAENLIELGAAIVRGEGGFDEAVVISRAAVSRSGELVRATHVDPSSRSDLLSYPLKAGVDGGKP